ncbi:MAG: DNA polymerase III subunit delta [Acidimicrobiales bacterium]|nr:DNA polymerase III subunit delta [Acidimicrobiales bacterium]
MARSQGTVPPIILYKGDDPGLVADAVRSRVAELVGTGDRSLMVEELDVSRYEGDGGKPDISPIVDAARTPPFLAERRIVVGRQFGVFRADDLPPLLDYLDDPLETTVLVLAWERGPKPQDSLPTVPKKLLDAIAKAGGEVVDTSPGKGRDRKDWFAEQLARAPVRLDAAAKAMLADHLGEDVACLPSVLATLESVYGPEASLGAAEVEPYLLVRGEVAPWDLTDAIDRGDVTLALDRLHRLLGGGERHGLQIMATLHNHYSRMLALDGANVRDERAAARILGIKGSTFPAKKALEQGRRLGSARLREFIGLLAQADLDLRGAKAWPDELVLEVLVARLASRSRR